MVQSLDPLTRCVVTGWNVKAVIESRWSYSVLITGWFSFSCRWACCDSAIKMPIPNQQTASEIMKERERLYKLIIGQLRSDKFETVAYELTVALKNATGGFMIQSAPTNRLSQLVQYGLKYEELNEETETHSKKLEKATNLGPGLDLEYDTDDMNHLKLLLLKVAQQSIFVLFSILIALILHQLCKCTILGREPCTSCIVVPLHCLRLPGVLAMSWIALKWNYVSSWLSVLSRICQHVCSCLVFPM